MHINNSQSDKNLSTTPLELADIFYEEARRIAKDETEAQEMTDKALKSFIARYKISPLSSIAIRTVKTTPAPVAGRPLSISGNV